MKTLLLIVAIVLNFVFFIPNSASEEVIRGTTDDPLKASAAFIVGLTLKHEVSIVEKIKTSKKIPWKNVEEHVREHSNTYKNVLVKLGKRERLLVCLFEYEDANVSMTIYRHFFVYGESWE